MAELDRIRDQLKGSLEGEAWCGRSVMELLDGVSAEQAITKLSDSTHSIWELIGHLTFWLEESLARVQERGSDQLSDSDNFPSPPDVVDEPTWQEHKDSLRRAHDTWYTAMDVIDSDKLHEPQQEIYPSLYVILHGLVQHNMYHGGQIAMLKKQL